jgi:hypothetical protein
MRRSRSRSSWATTPRLAGMIRYNAEGARESAAFEYDATWLSAPDRFSIDPALAARRRARSFHKKTRDGSLFHAAIADTEPDGWGRRVILRDHAKRMQGARRAGRAGGLATLSVTSTSFLRSTIRAGLAPFGSRTRRGFSGALPSRVAARRRR